MKDVVGPAIRPALLAIACAPVSVFFLQHVEKWSAAWLAVAAMAYGSVYLIAFLLFGLVKSERDRVISMLGKIIVSRSSGSDTA